MTRTDGFTRSAARALQALVWAAALLLVACDNDVHFSPTAPRWPNDSLVGDRSLQISGSLTAEGGSCLEATILYDGVELAGARARCHDPGGCAELELAATSRTRAGRHTISFRVLAQSAEVVEYLGRGELLVTREGLSLGGARIHLGPERATLRAGESLDFEVSFVD